MIASANWWSIVGNLDHKLFGAEIYFNKSLKKYIRFAFFFPVGATGQPPPLPSSLDSSFKSAKQLVDQLAVHTGFRLMKSFSELRESLGPEVNVEVRKLKGGFPLWDSEKYLEPKSDLKTTSIC